MRTRRCGGGRRWPAAASATRQPPRCSSTSWPTVTPPWPGLPPSGSGSWPTPRRSSSLAARLSGDAVRAAPTVAGEAATALSRTDHPAAHAAVVSFLRDSDAAGDAARLAIAPALLAFWRLPAGADLTGPRRWADHADADLRFAAAHALFRRPTAESLDLALTMAGDADARVRLLALRGLAASVAGESRDAAWRVVAERAADPDPMVRIGALRAAGTYAGSTSAALIARAFGDEPPVALAAIEALGAMGTPAAGQSEALVAIARDDDRPVQLRGAAVEALASVAPGDAEPVVAELAGSAEWRLRAAAARSAVRLAASPHEVRGLVRDRDVRVASAAYGALAARAASDPGAAAAIRAACPGDAGIGAGRPPPGGGAAGAGPRRRGAGPPPGARRLRGRPAGPGAGRGHRRARGAGRAAGAQRPGRASLRPPLRAPGRCAAPPRRRGRPAGAGCPLGTARSGGDGANE
jgi:HEAT repeat protein